MIVRKPLAVAVLSLSLAGLTACGSVEPEPLRCEVGYVVEYDDDGAECEIDSNGNGVDDENEDGISGEEAGAGAVVGGTAKKLLKKKKRSSGFGVSTRSSTRSSSVRSGRR